MLKQLSDGFYRQSRRDQWVLLLGGGCVLIYAIWFFLLEPLEEKTAVERTHTESVASALVRVQRLASRLYSAQELEQHAKQKPSISIAELVDRSLQANGLVMRGFQPSGRGEVKLRLDNVAYSGLIQWLHELEVAQGVQVKELAMSAGSEAGLVMVNVRLRKE